MKKIISMISALALMSSLVLPYSNVIVGNNPIYAAEVTEDKEQILTQGKRELNDLKRSAEFKLSGGNNGFWEQFLFTFNDIYSSLDSADSAEDAKTKVSAAKERFNTTFEAALDEALADSKNVVDTHINSGKNDAAWTEEAKKKLDDYRQKLYTSLDAAREEYSRQADLTETLKNNIYAITSRFEREVAIEKLEAKVNKIVDGNASAEEGKKLTEEQLENIKTALADYKQKLQAIVFDNHATKNQELKNLEAEANQKIDELNVPKPKEETSDNQENKKTFKINFNDLMGNPVTSIMIEPGKSLKDNGETLPTVNTGGATRYGWIDSERKDLYIPLLEKFVGVSQGSPELEANRKKLRESVIKEDTVLGEAGKAGEMTLYYISNRAWQYASFFTDSDSSSWKDRNIVNRTLATLKALDYRRSGYETMPEHPTEEEGWLNPHGYEFIGWYTRGTEGEISGENKAGIRYKKVTPDSPISSQQYALYKINYKLHFEDGKTPEQTAFIYRTPSALPYVKEIHNFVENPTAEGKVFKGWYTEQNGQGKKMTKSQLSNWSGASSRDLYAYWVDQLTVTKKLATGDEIIKLEKGAKLTATQLTTPEVAGKTFLEWNTAADGTGTTVTTDTIIEENMDIYPVYTVNVIFDSNGGSDIKNKTVAVVVGQTIGEKFPEEVPSRSEHDFLGWFTDRTAGDSVSAATAPSEATTYYAHWQEWETLLLPTVTTISKDGDDYVIKGNAPIGSTVVIKGVGGNDIEVPVNEDGTFEVRIPATQVTDKVDGKIYTKENGKKSSSETDFSIDPSGPNPPVVKPAKESDTTVEVEVPDINADNKTTKIKVNVNNGEDNKTIELSIGEDNIWKKADGTPVEVKKDGDKTYLSIPLSKPLKGGEIVRVTSYDKIGNTSEVTTTVSTLDRVTVTVIRGDESSDYEIVKGSKLPEEALPNTSYIEGGILNCYNTMLDATGDVITKDTVFDEDTVVFCVVEVSINFLDPDSDEADEREKGFFSNHFVGVPIGQFYNKEDKLGFNFEGWYTEKDGGEKLTEDFIVEEPIKVYARWKTAVTSVPADAPVIEPLPTFNIEDIPDITETTDNTESTVTTETTNTTKSVEDNKQSETLTNSDKPETEETNTSVAKSSSKSKKATNKKGSSSLAKTGEQAEYMAVACLMMLAMLVVIRKVKEENN